MPGRSFERFLAGILKPAYKVVRASEDKGYDFVSKDGSRIIQAKLSLQSGSRDFRAAVLGLATILAREPGVSQAILLIRVGRLTLRRAVEEWQRAVEVLRDDVGRRMALVLFAPDGDKIIPEKAPELVWIRDHVSIATPSFTEPTSRLGIPWSPIVLEVWKVIVTAWLRGEAPLQIQEIERRSGTSYPTVTATLDLLRDRQEIERLSNRSVRLRGFPRRSLGEIVVLGRSLRMTAFFRDRTSREPDPMQLLRRLRRKAPKGVALGGVLAARHYDPDFDLNGTPRIDVTITRNASLSSWWRETDPGIDVVPAWEPGVVMVSHVLLRPEHDFEKAPDEPLPLADPTETLLDLYELRLEAQAERMVSRLRARSGDV